MSEYPQSLLMSMDVEQGGDEMPTSPELEAKLKEYDCADLEEYNTKYMIGQILDLDAEGRQAMVDLQVAMEDARAEVFGTWQKKVTEASIIPVETTQMISLQEDGDLLIFMAENGLLTEEQIEAVGMEILDEA